MKLTIDNLDGRGPIDYSDAIGSGSPLVISRKWNAATVCTVSLLPCGGLPAPVRGARLVVADDAGAHLFTGYVELEPALHYVGTGAEGAVYERATTALSDEIILDRQTVPQTTATSGQSFSAALEAFTGRIGQMPIAVDALLDQVAVSEFAAQPGRSWSENAGRLTTAAGATYRALDGAVAVSQVGSAVHTLDEKDGTLNVGGLSAALTRAPVNDVTVFGGAEPSAYVTEVFRGDGITSAFELGSLPYVPAAGAAKPLADQFELGSVNGLQWTVNDPSSLISVSDKGLTFKGGTGMDGTTFVASIDQIELGGQVIAEVAGLQVQPGGTGVLCGLYTGGRLLDQCFAGLRVEQSSGGQVIRPIIMGSYAGAQQPLTAGRSYTLRMRLYCQEIQRTLQTYRYLQGNEMASLGGDQLDSPAKITLEIQDVSNGIHGTVTVLYDGTAESSPAACNFVALNSISLSGSMQSISVKQTGSAWVTVQPPGGVVTTRRMGTAAEGANCILDRMGRLQFYAGSIPKAGELITVNYRTTGRSVSRIADPQSIAQEGSSRWAGSVVSPSPRSSADCGNAAAALLAIAEDRNAAWKGRYTGFNMQSMGDIWPGDLLEIINDSAQMRASVAVREVQLEVGSSSPELVKYSIQFANDWAESLSITVSATVPAVAWFPAQPASAASALANLQGLSISGADSNSIQVQAGIMPPACGGFEVRRRDWAFRPGNDPDLVLRSPVPNFSIPREAAGEHFYVRMYDGSVPPVYSRFSSAIFNNVPM